mmetsp:Transcript_15175/g.40163  ORF Transcript_15175/g.40163 Transcript_15175/m.40163 type:complete len:267 (+) Transcript_15175:115-915(+)
MLQDAVRTALGARAGRVIALHVAVANWVGQAAPDRCLGPRTAIKKHSNAHEGDIQAEEDADVNPRFVEAVLQQGVDATEDGCGIEGQRKERAQGDGEHGAGPLEQQTPIGEAVAHGHGERSDAENQRDAPEDQAHNTESGRGAIDDLPADVVQYIGNVDREDGHRVSVGDTDLPQRSMQKTRQLLLHEQVERGQCSGLAGVPADKAKELRKTYHIALDDLAVCLAQAGGLKDAEVLHPFVDGVHFPSPPPEDQREPEERGQEDDGT